MCYRRFFLFILISSFATSAGMAESAPIQPLGQVRFDKEVTIPAERLRRMRQQDPHYGLDVFVAFKDQFFSDQKSYPAFAKKHEATPRAKLRADVMEQLKAKAAVSEKEFTAPDGFEIHGFYWLVNGVWGRADSEEVLKEIAKREDVLAIYRLPRRGFGRGGGEMEAKWLKEPESDEPAFALGDLEKGRGLDLVRAPEVWANEKQTGEGVVAAVFDGGVHPGSPDLRRAMWRNPKEEANGKDDDGNGYVDDIFGINVPQKNGNIVPQAQPERPMVKGPTSHGTVCAGIIAGRGASGVLTGVAPRAKVMACVGVSPLWIDSLQYCLEQDVDIVSMSFMGEQPYMFRALWRRQAEHASAAGLFLCGGAGNFGNKPQYKNKPQIWIPKSIPCIMAGAGLTDKGEHASFSSLGPVSWEKVPGYGEKEVRKPDVAALAERLTAVRFDDGKPEPGPNGNSFSGPQLAGCAALMLGKNADLKPWQLMRIMNETAVDIGEPGWDSKFGWGRLDCVEAVKAAGK